MTLSPDVELDAGAGGAGVTWRTPLVGQVPGSAGATCCAGGTHLDRADVLSILATTFVGKFSVVFNNGSFIS